MNSYENFPSAEDTELISNLGTRWPELRVPFTKTTKTEGAGTKTGKRINVAAQLRPGKWSGHAPGASNPPQYLVAGGGEGQRGPASPTYSLSCSRLRL